MEDVFELQDEIARKIAEALRVTLSPQEEAALASKPTENLQAYDLYLRGKSYARRLTRQDNEFALQMFENAVALDPGFALAHAAIANVCAQTHYSYGRDPGWLERARAASRKAVALRPELPEPGVAHAWSLYADGRYDDAEQTVRQAIERKSDCEGAYYLLGRTLFAAGRYQELADVAEKAMEAGGQDYNIFVPIQNALGALGKTEALRSTSGSARSRRSRTTSGPCRRTRAPASSSRATTRSRAGPRTRSARRTSPSPCARTRPRSSTTRRASSAASRTSLRRSSAMKKAWNAGFRDADWARRDPDLSFLHGDPEFERLFPEPAARS